MANVLIQPVSGAIQFNEQTAGGTCVPDLSGGFGIQLSQVDSSGLQVESHFGGLTGGTRFSVQGDGGQLLGVTDALTGDVFSVNDASGLPIINVNSCFIDVVKIGTHGTNALVVSGGNVGIGTSQPSQQKLTVAGGVSAIGLSSMAVNKGFVSAGRDLSDIFATTAGSGFIDGTGTAHKIPVWSDSNTLGDSPLSTNGSSNVIFPDNVIAKFGSDNDLYVRHTGSTGFVSNNTGDFYIENSTNDGDILFRSDDGSGDLDNYIRIDGGSHCIDFYKDTHHSDGVVAKFGTGSDLLIQHDGNHSYVYANGTGDLRIEQYTDNTDICLSTDDGYGNTVAYVCLDGSEEKILLSPGLPASAGQVGIGMTPTAKLHIPDQAIVGIGNATCGDLQIKHTSSDSYISNYTGDLYFRNDATDKDLVFQSDDGSGSMATYFYLDGSLADGTNTYTAFPDNSRIRMGTGLDLDIHHDGSDSYINQTGVGSLLIQQTIDDEDIRIFNDNGYGGTAEYMRFDGSEEKLLISIGLPASAGQVGIGMTPTAKLHIPDDALVGIGSGTNGDLQIKHTSDNSYIENTTGDLYINNTHDDKDIIFRTDNGSGGMATYLCIDGTNNRTTFPANANMQDNVRMYFGSGLDMQIYHDGSSSIIQNDTGHLDIKNTTNDGDMRFYADNGYGGDAEYVRLDGGAEQILIGAGLPASAGEVGIGTTSPESKLHVAGGDIRLDNAKSLLGETNAGGNFQMVKIDTSDNMLIGDGNISVDITGTSPRLIIDSGGTVTTSGSLSSCGGITSCCGTIEGKLVRGTSCVIASKVDSQYIGNTAETCITSGCLGCVQIGNSKGMAMTLSANANVAQVGIGMAPTEALQLADSCTLALGTGGDLQIYHNGSHSYIRDVGTGGFYLQTNGPALYFQDTDGNALAQFTDGGSNFLFYNGSERFRTTSDGVRIAGSSTIVGSITSQGYCSDDTANTCIGSDALEDLTTGCCNTAVGHCAANSLTTGTDNVAMGHLSLKLNLTGDDNVAIGYGAGCKNTTSQNIMIGYEAGRFTTGGCCNNMIGFKAGFCNVSGVNNTFIGNCAGCGNTAGAHNIAIGTFTKAGGGATHGDSNVIIGGSAGTCLNTDNNVLIGEQAGRYLSGGRGNDMLNVSVGVCTLRGAVTDQSGSGGGCNVAIGHKAMMSNTTGPYNTVAGCGAMTTNTTGCCNVSLGRNNMLYNTTGDQNTSVGTGALQANTTANLNVAVGARSMISNTIGGQNVAVGSCSLTNSVTGTEGVAIGYQALCKNNCTSFETAIGYQALKVSLTGTNNTAVGYKAGCLIEAPGNTAVGTNALRQTTTGNDNTGVGTQVLYNNTTGYYNTSIGNNSSYNTNTGLGNTSIGSNAFHANQTGSYNAAMGLNTLCNNTDGHCNVAIGYGAGRYQAGEGSNVTSADNSTYVGARTQGSGASPTNETVIGFCACGCGDNTISIGNGDSTYAYFGGDIFLKDSQKAFYGTGGDLAIYHNGGTSYLENSSCHLVINQVSNNRDVCILASSVHGNQKEYVHIDSSVGELRLTSGVASSAAKVTVAGALSTINGLSAQGGSGPVVFGQDDHGVDVTFYGDTADRFANWDASDNRFELEDNVGINFGSGGDLQIIHDSADSCIINNNRCLYIIANDTDSDIKFMADNGSGTETEYFRVDGGYGGICYFKGTLHADGVQASYGTGNDMQVFHNGADGFITNGTGELRITGNEQVTVVGNISAHGSLSATGAQDNYFKNKVGIGTPDPQDKFHVCAGSIRVDSGYAICHEACANFMHYSDWYFCNNTGHIKFDQDAANCDIIFCGDHGSGKFVFACMDMSAEIFEVKGAVKKTVDINAQTGTTYTLVLADQTRLVTSSNASAQTITVPPNSSVAFPTGSEVTIAQYGAGQVTIAAGSGVTLYAADSELKTRVQYSTAILTKIATDTWLVAGDLTA